MTRDFPAGLESLYEALEFVRHAAIEAGLDPRDAQGLELALEEILVNVCNYAYEPGQEGLMRIRVGAEEGRVVVEVEDWGREFTPPRGGPAAHEATCVDEAPIGGLGVFLAGQMLDELTYRREEQRNIVRMTMRTPSCGAV